MIYYKGFKLIRHVCKYRKLSGLYWIITNDEAIYYADTLKEAIARIDRYYGGEII